MTLVERLREMREYRGRIYEVSGDGVDILLAEAADALEAAEKALSQLHEYLDDALDIPLSESGWRELARSWRDETVAAALSKLRWTEGETK